MNNLDTEKVKKLEERVHTLSKQLEQRRDSTFARHPFGFLAISTFGVVATMYGFEKIIDEILVFEKNPEILLAVGVFTLFITGTLYKKSD